jgi:uncharacterized protein
MTSETATGNNETTQIPVNLKGLAQVDAAAKKSKGLPPVHLWNPPFCGDLDMRIASDGTWYYMGSPIGRKPMVRLFSTVLRHDEDGKYYLVTPVEKVGIQVEDAPFLAVEMAVEGQDAQQVITFTTNVGDRFQVDGAHPLRFETEKNTDGLKPYVLVRGRLEALINRAVLYDLVELGCEHEVDGNVHFGVWSSGVFYAMATADELTIV